MNDGIKNDRMEGCMQEFINERIIVQRYKVDYTGMFDSATELQDNRIRKYLKLQN